MRNGVTFSIGKKADEESLTEWLSSQTPWKSRYGYFSDMFFFWNMITRKMTGLNKQSMSRNFLYFPTNSPETGERFITLVLAVNGDYDINYDEDENRFDKMFRYLSDEHKTRVDIYVNRQCKKPKRSKDGKETEKEDGQPDADDPQRGEVREEDTGA